MLKAILIGVLLSLLASTLFPIWGYWRNTPGGIEGRIARRRRRIERSHGYQCDVCGSQDMLHFMHCDHPGCPDADL